MLFLKRFMIFAGQQNIRINVQNIDNGVSLKFIIGECCVSKDANIMIFMKHSA